MKLLFILPAHHKILNNMKLGFQQYTVKYTKTPTMGDILDCDIVYSPATQIPIQNYPTVKFIFGPNFSTFPSTKTTFNNIHKNAIYIQPSEWVCQLWRELHYTHLPLYVSPVGVDVELFSPGDSSERSRTFIYFKRRQNSELKTLHTQFPTAKIFKYGEYKETEYLDYLQHSKFGIWLGAHESEGFALLEALSCNVPLLVWNVTKMSQEVGSPQSYRKIKTVTTTIPYWDSRCGEVFYNCKDLYETKNVFLNTLDRYEPRRFILDTLCLEETTNNFVKMWDMTWNSQKTAKK